MTEEELNIWERSTGVIEVLTCKEFGAWLHRRDMNIKAQALESQRWIPKNATNGDMIISLYPNLKYYVNGDRMMTTIGVASSFDLEWWNAPYREGGVE